MCLHLVEVLVKNCEVVVHREIGTEKFMKTIVSVVKDTTGKTKADAREAHEKALELIQAWGEAFLPKQVSASVKEVGSGLLAANASTSPLVGVAHAQRDPGLRWFVLTYQKLRQQGVKFPKPQMDDKAAPIFTPPVHIPPDTEAERKVDTHSGMCP